MLRRSFVPPQAVRDLRALTRTRSRLAQDQARHQARVEKILEDALPKISVVISDLFGTSGRRFLDALVAGERSPQALAALGDCRLKASRAKLEEALTGRFRDIHATEIALHLRLIDAINAEITALDEQIGQQLAAVPGTAPACTGCGLACGGHTPGCDDLGILLLGLADRLDLPPCASQTRGARQARGSHPRRRANPGAKPPSLDNSQMRDRRGHGAGRFTHSRRAGQCGNAFTGLRQPRDKRGQRDVERGSSLSMGKAGQNDNQQGLSELNRQRADSRGHSDPAGGSPTASTFCALVPSPFAVVEGQAADVPAIKPHKLAERAHPPIFTSMPSSVVAGAWVHCLERSLPEQAFDKCSRSRVIEHEPIVSRQGQPEIDANQRDRPNCRLTAAPLTPRVCMSLEALTLVDDPSQKRLRFQARV